MKILEVYTMYLDYSTNSFVKAEDQMSLANEEINQYLLNMIDKNGVNPNIKKGYFKQESLVEKKIAAYINSQMRFVELANEVVLDIYQEVMATDKVVNYNVLVFLLEENNIKQMALYMYEQKPIYVLENGILKKELNELSTLDMFFNVDLNTFEVNMLDKRRIIEGETYQFLADRILKCDYNLSSRQTLNAVNKIAKKIAKTNNIDETETLTRVKSALVEKVKENETVKPKEIISMVFADENIALEMENEMDEANIPEVVDFDFNYVMKQTRIQKIKTDTGIEISIPASYFQDSSFVDFIDLDDGTMEIILKKIASISNK